jgi:hypothetical protein
MSYGRPNVISVDAAEQRAVIRSRSATATA